MSAPDLDFSRLRPHGGDRKFAFEELCSQLGSLEPRGAGATFYRKGLGPDAGVECFLRRTNGDETGWQAKFFSEFDNSQVGQLDESIESALKRHPRLTTYIVCMPINLRDPRGRGKKQTELQRWEKWKEKWEKRAKARKLKIELWDATAIGSRLQRKEPKYEGRLAYWFDENVLTAQWFKQRFEQAKANLGHRYTPERRRSRRIRRCAATSIERTPTSGPA